MLDANIVIARCIEQVYESAAPHHPVRIGTIAGRVLPKSDGSQIVKIQVNILYPGANGRPGEERFAPIDCVIENTGHLTIKAHQP